MLPYALHVHFHLHDSWILHGAPSVNTSYWGGEIAQEWWNGLWVCPLTLRGLWRDLREGDCDFHTSLIPSCTFLVAGWLNIITYNGPCLETGSMVLVTRIVSMLTKPNYLGQLAPSHQLLSPKWNISITRKGNAQRGEGTHLV